MSTEEPKPTDGEANNNQTQTGDQSAAPSTTNEPTRPAATGNSSNSGGASAASARMSAPEDDDDEAPSDFGAMLDQFEQEQAAFQEGEVVRGTVVGITERGVVIEFGYKSEGIVPQAEFMDAGQLTVKPGDEVEVLIKSMESSEGFPLLSRVNPVHTKIWEEIEKADRKSVV